MDGLSVEQEHWLDVPWWSTGGQSFVLVICAYVLQEHDGIDHALLWGILGHHWFLFEWSQKLPPLCFGNKLLKFPAKFTLSRQDNPLCTIKLCLNQCIVTGPIAFLVAALVQKKRHAGTVTPAAQLKLTTGWKTSTLTPLRLVWLSAPTLHLFLHKYLAAPPTFSLLDTQISFELCRSRQWQHLTTFFDRSCHIARKESRQSAPVFLK